MSPCTCVGWLVWLDSSDGYTGVGMSGPGSPSSGFQWVQPGAGASARPRRGRWWWLVLACLAVVVVVAGGVAAVHWWPRGNHAPTSKAQEAPIGTPKDRLIGFALDRQPVPAWQVSVTDLGLTPQTGVGDLFASVGSKAYFQSLRGDDEKQPTGLVYGLDVKSGKALFPTVELPGWDSGSCSTNGPSVAICVTDKCREGMAYCLGPELVWVIDLEHGVVTYTGEAKVQARSSVESFHPGRPVLKALGPSLGATWLVAAVQGKGVYGVGSHGEPTWFLPGSGVLNGVFDPKVDDIAPLTVGLQGPDSESGHDLRVFSFDGRDLTPKAPDGQRIAEAQAYVGGFSVEFDKGPFHQGVGLYDSDGRQVAMLTDGYQTSASVAMPIVVPKGSEKNPPDSGQQVYTAAGKLQVQIGASLFDSFRMIGTKVYGGEPPNAWRSWDLLTGRQGPACNVDLKFGYVGSDGATIIWRDPKHVTDAVFAAVDPATCQTSWEMPVNTGPNSSQLLQKAGTGLLQLTGDTIVGLRAPA